MINILKSKKPPSIGRLFVGMARFELATSWSQTRRDDQTTLHPEKDCPRVARRQFYNIVAATYFPTFYCSIIGGVGLNFSVRNGKR